MENSEDLGHALSTHASVSGGAFGVEFSASTGFRKETEKFTSSNFKIIESYAQCKYYNAELKLYSKPDFSDSLKHALNIMNSSSHSSGSLSQSDLFIFLENFGTHYIEKAVYGARYTNVFTMSASNYDNMISNGVDVEFSAGYSGPIVSASASFGMSKEDQRKIEIFKKNVHRETFSMGSLPPEDGDSGNWASTVTENPLPIELHMKPIWELFDPMIFPNIRQHLTDSTAGNVKSAIIETQNAYCHHVIKTEDAAYLCNDPPPTADPNEIVG